MYIIKGNWILLNVGFIPNRVIPIEDFLELGSAALSLGALEALISLRNWSLLS